MNISTTNFLFFLRYNCSVISIVLLISYCFLANYSFVNTAQLPCNNNKIQRVTSYRDADPYREHDSTILSLFPLARRDSAYLVSNSSIVALQTVAVPVSVSAKLGSPLGLHSFGSITRALASFRRFLAFRAFFNVTWFCPHSEHQP